MPDKKIVNFETARKAHRNDKPSLIELLNRLDELESTLETLDEHGITTRDELVELMRKLEQQVDEADN